MRPLKMELFVMKNRKWLETVVDCCYIGFHLKCDRAPRSGSKMHRQIEIKAIKYSTRHLHVQSQQKKTH